MVGIYDNQLQVVGLKNHGSTLPKKWYEVAYDLGVQISLSSTTI
jgi:hypothetical protein